MPDSTTIGGYVFQSDGTIALVNGGIEPGIWLRSLRIDADDARVIAEALKKNTMVTSINLRQLPYRHCRH